MLCDFSEGLKCKRCGYEARVQRTFRECLTLDEMAERLARVTSPPWVPVPNPMLGDRVAGALEFFGITKERAKQLMGTEDCGCEKRQKGLNRVSGAIAKAAEVVIDAVGDSLLGDREVPGHKEQVRQHLLASTDTNPGLKEGPKPALTHNTTPSH